MSDILNHLYCGQVVLDKLNTNSSFSKINVELFNLGTQGPDFFFYDGALPWTKSMGLSIYGSMLHRCSANRLFYELLNVAFEEMNDELKENILSYVYGVICHHALDSLTHPYINYISGIYDEEKPETYGYKYSHKKIEVAIDIAYTNYTNKARVTTQEYWKVFDVNDENKKTLHYIYKKLLKNLFDKDIKEEEINKCLKDAYKTNKFTCDRTGRKMKLFSLIEKIVSKAPYKFTRAIYVDDLKDNIDYLNLKHNIWQNPCNGTKSTEPYTELFDKACIRTISNIEKLSDTTRQKINIQNIDEIFGDLSFETGLKYDLDNIMKYSKSILQ